MGAKPSFRHIRGGGETIEARILKNTGPDAIVDWVFLELRWEFDPSKILATRAALVQRDGDIVDTDGISPVSFKQPKDYYYLAVRHRNHLGAMTAKPILLTAQVQQLIDFTDVDQATYQLSTSSKSSPYSMKRVGDIYCLWGGNSNADRQLIFQGPNLDQEKLFFDIALHPNNADANYNFIVRGYTLGDNNMDGEATYQGPNNDIDDLQFFNILFHQENELHLTNKIIYEQLP